MNEETKIIDYTFDFNCTRECIDFVFAALREKEYNPEQQMTEYLLSRDPLFITNYNNARQRILKYRVEELIRFFIKFYVENVKEECDYGEKRTKITCKKK